VGTNGYLTHIDAGFSLLDVTAARLKCTSILASSDQANRAQAAA
jgi:hypothetical protein